MTDMASRFSARPADPSTVPVYPVVRLEVVPTDTGFEGRLDGHSAYGGSRSEVERHLIGAAARVAEDRPGDAVRVVAEGFSTLDRRGVVTSTGDFVPNDPPAPRRPQAGRWAAVAAALLVVIAAAGLVVVARARGGVSVSGAVPAGTVPSVVARPTELPVEQPPGWSSVATWSRVLGSSSSRVSVSASGPLVFAPGDGSGSVVGLDVSSGRQVWSASVPGSLMGSALAGGPVVVLMGERPVVAAWSTSLLVAWDPSTGGQVGSWPLPADAGQVSVFGSRLLVSGQSRHVGVLASDGLGWRVLAATAGPVGATGGGELLAVGPGRLWRGSSNEVAGDPIALAAPEGKGVAWSGPLGATDEVLVVAYGTSSSAVVLRGFSVVSGSVVWTSTPVPAASSSAWWWASPDGAWAVYGATWVDLATGAVKALPAGWSTVAGDERMAFGTAGSRVAVVTREGSTSAPTSVVDPRAVTAATAPAAVAADGTAFVVAADGSQTVLYAVPSVVGGRS